MQPTQSRNPLDLTDSYILNKVTHKIQRCYISYPNITSKYAINWINIFSYFTPPKKQYFKVKSEFKSRDHVSNS